MILVEQLYPPLFNFVKRFYINLSTTSDNAVKCSRLKAAELTFRSGKTLYSEAVRLAKTCLHVFVAYAAAPYLFQNLTLSRHRLGLPP